METMASYLNKSVSQPVLFVTPKSRKSVVYKDKSGTTVINWPLIPRMSHLKPESVEEAKITARTSPEYLSRRKGDIPVAIQKLINTGFAKII
jgi:hypothetical protein